VETMSGMDPGSRSTTVQISILGSQLSTLESQLIQLQEQVEFLQQGNMADKERIVHLEQVTQELERRVSTLESACGKTEIETDISESLMVIGGYEATAQKVLRSAEVLNTSCDFPLPKNDARDGHISVTTSDGKTLVCGGYTGTKDAPSCLQFNYQTKKWEPHSILTKPRRFSSVIELKSGVYILGGEADDARLSSEFLATGSSEWTQGPDIPGRMGVRQSCAAKLSDTEFVILGGFYDGTQALVYSETSGEWRHWPKLPEDQGVFGQSCVGLGDIVLMAGGWDPAVITGRTIIFDAKTGSAREVASLRYPRHEHRMVLYRGKVVILGGEDDDTGLRTDGEMWNMDTETWEEAPIALSTARWSFSLVRLAEEIKCN